MSKTWEQRVETYWNTTAGKSAEQLREELGELLQGRDPADPRVLFEIASLHDFLGEEEQAVLPYQRALQAGLSGQKQEEALIQLASTLRNLGQPRRAMALLEPIQPSSVLHADAQGFLALALLDAGRSAEALRTAITALAPHARLYGRALAAYAQDLDIPGAAQR
ncbi:tetratricopeptide repeat protein [Glutamicibacter sp. JL.03c]|uniref:tetratricopeptide repeat protein n=1 Tax=Glutamicibacter sp. JL.03c TaxID=2984842 RepID=UPI0021F72A57|nr:tetratricopeptide repeat protein [Glutamicibacter sp. JL.03c]UYQ78319.1 tetratricopeptide repeat protein [Glutamicibacter sp. JL.03c]